MKSSIFIPKKINVGYQNRSGTYTGKLAYVIYYDEKGKLRKEASWNGWRDENIPNTEFDNVPTEGFVLNKKAGDYSSGWDHRQAYCRVYDPRGFEFEITIDNLLYILENTNSIKGKGLEGDFVYGWSGKDLILIPTESPDYKEMKKYNDIVHNNETIKAKDLIVGATYITKGNEEYIYMGKFDYYSRGYKWLENGIYKTSKKYDDVPLSRNMRTYRINYEDIDLNYGKYFWFAYKYYDYHYKNGKKVYDSKYKWSFVQMKNMSGKKIISCINSECTPEYADIYENMICKCTFSPRDKKKYIPYTFEEFKNIVSLIDIDLYRTRKRFYSDTENIYVLRKNNKELLIAEQPYSSNEEDYYNRFDFKTVNGTYNFSLMSETKKEFIPLTVEQMYEKLKPHYQEVYLENGKLYERNCYYGKE